MVSTRERSRFHEERVCEAYSAILNPNSGAVPVLALKGDARNSDFHIEAKATTRGAFSVSRSLVQGTAKLARSQGKDWILDVEFQDENPRIVHEAIAVVSRDLFVELFDQRLSGAGKDSPQERLDALIRGLRKLPMSTRVEVVDSLKSVSSLSIVDSLVREILS